jgi:malonyl-CoA O-methyltransferase
MMTLALTDVTVRPAQLQVSVVEPLSEAIPVDELVLLHGWGIDSRIWHQLIPHLRHRCRLHLIDLPGFGANAAINLWGDEAAMLAALAAALPPRAHLLGWSLGGNIALAFARRYPQRVQSLSLVACNPSFVVRDAHVSAMPQAVFDDFLGAVHGDAARALTRFEQLQCRGDQRGKSLAMALRSLPGAQLRYELRALLDALDYLGQVDQRVQLSDSSMRPAPLFILGAGDALVPVALASQLARVKVMPGVAHVPMLADPEGLAALVLAEIRCHPGAEVKLRKQRVARSFSAAAATYDSVAELQRAVASSLLEHALGPIADSPSGVGIDLGCGTGWPLQQLREHQPQRCWLGGDIALGMLQHIRAISAAPDRRLLALDAENLPVGDASIAMLFSNLALQWCEDLDALFSEVARVLAPGGRLVFSTLVHGTLHELRAAWSTVDEHAHVNHFYQDSQWSRAVDRAGLKSLVWQRETRVTHYPELAGLVHELKALGAHNVNQGRSTGLTGRSQWRSLRRAYETHRQPDELLPATWRLLYGVLERPQAGAV